MTEPIEEPVPTEEEIAAAEADVEGHSVEDQESDSADSAPKYDINIGCA